MSGDENSLIKNDILLSFAISIPENNAINESPKTATPGVRFSISNKLTGILDCIMDNKKSKTKGNPKPKARFSGSLKISLVFREANANVFK